MATLIEANNPEYLTAMVVQATERVVVEILYEDNTVKQTLFDHNVATGKILTGEVRFTGTLVPV